LVDLDGDGHLDILSGSYSRMDKDMAGLIQVLYGKGDGTFRKAEVLKGTDGDGRPAAHHPHERPGPAHRENLHATLRRRF
jgi:hypothetical protein